jgi:hypothetical protein
MQSLPASRYAGASLLLSAPARGLRKDPSIAYPVGLEHDGCTLLQPFCPPYYKSMKDAVRAFVETKFGPDGSYLSYLAVRSSSLGRKDPCPAK